MKIDLHDLLILAGSGLFLAGLFWLHVAAGLSGLGVVCFITAMAIAARARRRRQ